MFDSGLIWFILGILFVLVVLGARAWAQDLKLNMNWWKWALVTLWYGLLNFTIAVPFTFWGENERNAALSLLLLLGVITIILGVGLFGFLWSKRNVEAITSEPA